MVVCEQEERAEVGIVRIIIERQGRWSKYSYMFRLALSSRAFHLLLVSHVGYCLNCLTNSCSLNIVASIQSAGRLIDQRRS
jgi:hypothetical protein